MSLTNIMKAKNYFNFLSIHVIFFNVKFHNCKKKINNFNFINAKLDNVLINTYEI